MQDHLMEDIHDALDPIPMAPPSHVPWLFVALCALMAIGAIWIVVKIVRYRLRRKPQLSPEERAWLRLSQADGLQVRAYYFELTAILAGYLDAHYDLQFAQCTSAETIRRLRDLGVMTKECFGAVREFLEEADRVKYAPSVVGADAESAGLRCRHIIELFAARTAAARHLSQQSPQQSPQPPAQEAA